ERLENPGQFRKRPARARWCKLVLQVHDPVRDLDEPHADRPRRVSGQSRCHRVQQRQCKDCSGAAQERTTVYGFLRIIQFLCSSRLNQWIGFFLTIPRTLDNRRRSPERASRTTSRITGDRSTKPIARRAAPVRNIALSRVWWRLNALIGNKKTTLFFP